MRQALLGGLLMLSLTASGLGQVTGEGGGTGFVPPGGGFYLDVREEELTNDRPGPRMERLEPPVARETWDEVFPVREGWGVVRKGKKWYFRREKDGRLVGPYDAAVPFGKRGNLGIGQLGNQIQYVLPDGSVSEPMKNPCCGDRIDSGEFLREGSSKTPAAGTKDSGKTPAAGTKDSGKTPAAGTKDSGKTPAAGT
ncbi:MAG: hypothetical protein AB1758_03145, partial [Candidatus Eremiobacterota bacterium]